MPLLSQYLLIVRNLIQSPSSPVPLIPDGLLTDYINLGRYQVALDAECVRGDATTTIGGGVVSVSIGAMLPQALEPGSVVQALVVRNAYLDSVRVDIRPWDWLQNYWRRKTPNLPVLPEVCMAHQGQGSFSTIFVASPAGGNLAADAVFLPVPLADDSTPDALPFPFWDAAAFYAAFYAYMALQRQADAQMFFGRYSEVLRRARAESTSTALPENDPGGVGAMIAATKTTLARALPAPQGRGAG